MCLVQHSEELGGPDITSTYYNYLGKGFLGKIDWEYKDFVVNIDDLSELKSHLLYIKYDCTYAERKTNMWNEIELRLKETPKDFMALRFVKRSNDFPDDTSSIHVVPYDSIEKYIWDLTHDTYGVTILESGIRRINIFNILNVINDFEVPLLK